MAELVANVTVQFDEKLKKALDDVYAERNLCVAALTRFAQLQRYRVGIMLLEGEEWEDEWRNVVFIDLPTGQVSWHIHESEIENFQHIGAYDGEWDGHTTEAKYQRLAQFFRTPPIVTGG